MIEKNGHIELTIPTVTPQQARAAMLATAAYAHDKDDLVNLLHILGLNQDATPATRH